MNVVKSDVEKLVQKELESANQRFPNERAEIRFIKGRLKFGNSKNSAPFPSMIVIFG